MRLILMCLFVSATLIQATTLSIPGTAVSQLSSGTVEYGQTFVLPDLTDTILTQFSFTFQGTGVYDAEIYQWNGDPNAATGAPVGPALYDSGPISAPTNLSQIYFNTGGIKLDPSLSYVAFLKSSELGNYSFFYNTGNPYSAGRAMQSSNPAFLTSGSWSASGALLDVAFQATFVPEPATILQATIGIVILAAGCALRRRRRSLADDLR